jgi:hypothetical protein
VKDCGVAVARPQGHSWAPRSSIDLKGTWEPSGPALARAASAAAGQAHRQPMGPGGAETP